MKRNLTLQIDEEIIRQAKVLAARRSTSVSRLVADEIERLVMADNRYQRSQQKALDHLRKGFRLGGGPLPSREPLHDR